MSSRVLIIAEAGVNHNGSLKIAKRLVDEASSAGADIIKFQTFKAEKLVSKSARQAEYQQRNIGGKGETQFSMLKRLEPRQNEHQELISYCTKSSVRLLSTAFYIEEFVSLHSLKLGLLKIPSGEITNYPYLRKIAGYCEPTIVSTGMCGLEDIEAALKVLLCNGLKKDLITVLHCNTEYPTPMHVGNLLAMKEISNRFGDKVGYSDHTEGIENPIAAVAFGASVIGTHLQLRQ